MGNFIAVVNKSTLVKSGDVQTMTRACATQVRYHVTPHWGTKSMPVVYYADEKLIPPGSWAIAVLDDSDQADALGWHTEEQGDLIYGRVFARPVFDNGGAALKGGLTVASVLSHEVVETFVDPHCNLWADSGNGLYAFEACDPVEDVSYAVSVTVGTTRVTVDVSDFVTPAWFDALAAAGELFSYKDSVSAPYRLTSGGYAVKMVEGKVSQVFGATYPEWRKATKQVDTARSARRHKALAA